MLINTQFSHVEQLRANVLDVARFLGCKAAREGG
jgi:hypothetical protein